VGVLVARVANPIWTRGFAICYTHIGTNRTYMSEALYSMTHDYPEAVGRCGGRKGALTEPLVLAALQRNVAHGYDLRATIATITDGEAVVDAGGLYRTLRRLEEDGFVTSAWQQSESGPQRRDYRITAEGLELAEDWAQHLRTRSRLLALVAGLLEEAGTASAVTPDTAQSATDGTEADR